jgi:hypothetical protein
LKEKLRIVVNIQNDSYVYKFFPVWFNILSPLWKSGCKVCSLLLWVRKNSVLCVSVFFYIPYYSLQHFNVCNCCVKVSYNAILQSSSVTPYHYWNCRYLKNYMVWHDANFIPYMICMGDDFEGCNFMTVICFIILWVCFL